MNIFASAVFSIMSGIVFIIITIFGTIKLIKTKKLEVIHQTYLMITHSSFSYSNETYKILDIPRLMKNYRLKFLSSSLCKTQEEEGSLKEEVYIDKTRISTFILFTDKKRIALIDRTNNTVQQAIRNPLLDCHGAVPFNNTSLPYKVSKEFLDSEILEIIAIPGLAIEKNQKKLLNMPIPNNFEKSIMIGFIVVISHDSLDTINNDKDGINNRIVNLSCISPDDRNLSSKLSLSIKFAKEFFYHAK